MQDFYLHQTFNIFVSLDVSASPHLHTTDFSTPLSIYSGSVAFAPFSIYTLKTHYSSNTPSIFWPLATFTHSLLPHLSSSLILFYTPRNSLQHSVSLLSPYLLLTTASLTLTPPHLPALTATPLPPDSVDFAFKCKYIQSLAPIPSFAAGGFISLIRLVLF